MSATLLKRLALFPIVAKFQFKKDIPKHVPGFPVRVDFGLWGLWYLVKSPNGLLMADGQEMPVHTAYLKDFGCVIGPHDLTAAEGTPMAEAWRESYRAAIDARLQLSLIQ